MKFGASQNGVQFGYTRDADNPHADDANPKAGIVAEFFEQSFHMKDLDGELLFEADGETPKMSKPVLYVRFRAMADKFSMPQRKATKADMREWAVAYELFEKGKSFTEQAGQSLELLPGLEMLQRAGLNANNVFTIEQLAQMPENVILGNPGWRALVNLARNHIVKFKPKPNQELLDEMAAMKAELAALKSAKAPKPQKELAA